MSAFDPKRTSSGRCENRLRKLRTQVCCDAQRTLRPPVRDEPIRRNEWNKAPPNGLRRRNSSAQRRDKKPPLPRLRRTDCSSIQLTFWIGAETALGLRCGGQSCQRNWY